MAGGTTWPDHSVFPPLVGVGRVRHSNGGWRPATLLNSGSKSQKVCAIQIIVAPPAATVSSFVRNRSK